MKVLILAGGFGTRLGPLSEIPKAMFLVDGDTLLNHLLKKIKGLNYVILTNQKFKNYFNGKKILVEDARSDKEKLGAVSAIANAIKRLNIKEDIFVLCSDNYFSSGFKEFLNSYDGNVLIGAYDITGKKEFKPEELGTLIVENSWVKKFKEKSKKPLSNLVAAGAYIFPQSIFPVLQSYCKNKRRDNLGDFIAYLLRKGIKVKAYVFKGIWYDISQKSFINVFSSGKLIKSDERYVVCDLEIGNMVLSVTILHPNKETRGHSHKVSEVYFFIEGEGEIQIDNNLQPVKAKDVIPLRPNQFHKVINNSDKDLMFLSVFEKYERS